jgi:TPR repeat protein
MRLVLLLTALLAFQGAAASEFDEMKALADQGMAAAQFNLGIMYDTCLGVSENDAEAVKWFRKAADQSSPDLI